MKLLLALLALLSLACIFSEVPQSCAPQWVTLAEGVWATYYGPKYVPGVSVTASGEFYGDGVALGPDLLTQARELTGQMWSFKVRIVDPATGIALLLPVTDTGLGPVGDTPGLEVDLPDDLWLRFGYPAKFGVIIVRVEAQK